MASIPLFFEKAHGLSHARDGRRVDDDGRIAVRFHRRQQHLSLRFAVRQFDVIVQIRPVEAGDVLVRIAQAELPQDVVPHLRVALAVNAAMGHSGNSSRSRRSCRYSGRNSCPHSKCSALRRSRKTPAARVPGNSMKSSRSSRSGDTYKQTGTRPSPRAA